MEQHRPASYPGSSAEAGVSYRAYVQLVLLGAMVPAELVTMLKWSAPAGALLLGGTLAASLTSEVGPRAWARIRGDSSPPEDDRRPGHGKITLRLSRATNGTIQRNVRRETIEASLRRVCRSGDSVSSSTSGEFIVELQGWTMIDPEAVGRRMALAVQNRLDVELRVNVERIRPSAEPPAVAPLESPLCGVSNDIVDGYSLRRNIFRGEPEASMSSGGEFFRRARARLQSLAPVAV